MSVYVFRHTLKLARVLFAPALKILKRSKCWGSDSAKTVQPLVVRILISRQRYRGSGVRRISVGGAFALAAWNGFMRAAEMLKSTAALRARQRSVIPDINGFLAEDLRAEFE
jgi:hypothetical protein